MQHGESEEHQAEDCHDPECGCRGKQPRTQEEWYEVGAEVKRSRAVQGKEETEDEEGRRGQSPGRGTEEIEPKQNIWEGNGDAARGEYRGWNADSESKYCIGCSRTCKALSKHLVKGTHIIAWELDASSPLRIRNTMFECTDCRAIRVDIEATETRRAYFTQELKSLAEGFELYNGDEEELKERRAKANRARRNRERESRCEERKRCHRHRNENEGSNLHCTRCGSGPSTTPDGLTCGCNRGWGCWEEGDAANKCVGCGTGLPMAKMAGGITYFSEASDSSWCCEPCNMIETEIDDLEEKLKETNKKLEEACQTAETAIRINSMWAASSASGVSRRAREERCGLNGAWGSREEGEGASSPKNGSKIKAGRCGKRRKATEAKAKKAKRKEREEGRREGGHFCRPGEQGEKQQWQQQ